MTEPTSTMRARTQPKRLSYTSTRKSPPPLHKAATEAAAPGPHLDNHSYTLLTIHAVPKHMYAQPQSFFESEQEKRRETLRVQGKERMDGHLQNKGGEMYNFGKAASCEKSLWYW